MKRLLRKLFAIGGLCAIGWLATSQNGCKYIKCANDTQINAYKPKNTQIKRLNANATNLNFEFDIDNNYFYVLQCENNNVLDNEYISIEFTMLTNDYQQEIYSDSISYLNNYNFFTIVIYNTNESNSNRIYTDTYYFNDATQRYIYKEIKNEIYSNNNDYVLNIANINNLNLSIFFESATQTNFNLTQCSNYAEDIAEDFTIMRGWSTLLTNQLHQIQELEYQVDTLTNQVNSLTSQVNSLTSQNASLTSQNNSLTRENASLTSQVNSLTSENASLTNQVNSLTSENASLQNSLRSLQSQNISLREQVQNLTSQVETLRNQNDTLLERNQNLEEENAQQAETIRQQSNRIDSLVSDLNDATRQLESASREIENLRTQLAENLPHNIIEWGKIFCNAFIDLFNIEMLPNFKVGYILIAPLLIPIISLFIKLIRGA